VDPIGWGFEKFDAIGRRREDYRLTFGGRGGGGGRMGGRVVTLPLDTTASVAGLKDASFSSPRGLGAILAGSQQCQECVVKQYFRYTSGRMEGPPDGPLLARVFAAFRDSGFKFKEMMISMVIAREFPGDEGSGHATSDHEAH
jgi:hypothetical protein